jgi:hypothetical protein
MYAKVSLRFVYEIFLVLAFVLCTVWIRYDWFNTDTLFVQFHRVLLLSLLRIEKKTFSS